MFARIGWAAAGAALMYLLDPARGGRRRSMARDQAVGRLHDAKEWAGGTTRYAAGHLQGLAAAARHRLSPGRAPTDDVLEERVRATIGHHVAEPGSIEIRANDGTIELSGSIPSDEAEDLRDAVRSVRGVRSVLDRLEVESFEGPTDGSDIASS